MMAGDKNDDEPNGFEGRECFGVLVCVWLIQGISGDRDDEMSDWVGGGDGDDDGGGGGDGDGVG